jgi:ABC-type Fe3+-siderophore transport system permease subunit
LSIYILAQACVSKSFVHELPKTKDPAGSRPETTKPKRFVWRAMTSVLIAASFLILLITGVVLFVSPPGRIANWTNWTILSLRKQEWIGLHVWFSTLFLLVTIFHLVFNWRPLMTYFKDRMTRRLGFRLEWLVALLICAGVYARHQNQIASVLDVVGLQRKS